MFIGAIVGGAGALLAYKGSKDAAKSAAQQQKEAIEAAKMDPRAEAIIYGDGADNKGLLSQYQTLGQAPQSAGLLSYGKGADDYLKGGAGSELQGMRDSAWNMAHSNTAAPQANAAAANAAQVGQTVWTEGNMVKAPSQNNVDTAGSFNSLINGEAGNNPFLTGAIGKGINQSTAAFQNMTSDATKATQNVLGGIRSNSVLSGQYGGSRQGIAEGQAIESMNTQLGRAASQFGQNNTDAAVAAQAGAYDADRNRQLQATQALSGQQYDVAKMDAATKNASEFRNVDQILDVQKTNAGFNQQTNLANLGATQQTNLANLGAQQQTNSLNSANQVAGLGAQQGLLGMTYGAAQGQDQYGMNKAQQTNGLLQPYLSNTGSQVAQPIYSNPTGGLLGGAMAGLGLYNQFKGATGTTQPYASSAGSGATTGMVNGMASGMGAGLGNMFGY